MTNKEAIEILRDTPIDIRSTREDIHTLYATAQLMVIEALEKQIPIKQGNLYTENSHLYVDCGGFVRCSKTKKDIRYPLVSLTDLEYCPRCGQALDWSKEGNTRLDLMRECGEEVE